MKAKRFFYSLKLLMIIALSINIAVDALTKSNIPVRTISGEIISITPVKIILEINGLYFQFPMVPDVRVFCNGLEASWSALTPVTPEAFFEAKVGLDRLNRVVFINGSYNGEECVITGWSGEGDQLVLKLFSPDEKSWKTGLVKQNARLPENGWLETGRIVFVLYNEEKKIRAIFLPD